MDVVELDAGHAASGCRTGAGDATHATRRGASVGRRAALRPTRRSGITARLADPPAAVRCRSVRHLTSSTRRPTSRHLDFAARALQAAGPRLLHDRLGRPREQRRGRGGAAADGPGAAALPIRRLLPGPGGPGSRVDTGPRRAAGIALRRRRADRRRAAQGVRQRCAVGDPADLDDRLAPAAGGRAGRRAAPGGQAGCRHAVAGRRRGRLLVRRRIGQPLHRHRRDQHRAQHRLSAPAGAHPVRLRGQRPGHLGAARRPAGSSARTAPGPGLHLRRGRRVRRRRDVRHRGGRRRARPHRRAGRSSCTCGPCASSVTQAATPRSATARRPRWRADYDRDPLLGTAAALVAAGPRHRRSCSPGTTQPRALVATTADELAGSRRAAVVPPR